MPFKTSLTSQVRRAGNLVIHLFPEDLSAGTNSTWSSNVSGTLVFSTRSGLTIGRRSLSKNSRSYGLAFSGSTALELSASQGLADLFQRGNYAVFCAYEAGNNEPILYVSSSGSPLTASYSSLAIYPNFSGSFAVERYGVPRQLVTGSLSGSQEYAAAINTQTGSISFRQNDTWYSDRLFVSSTGSVGPTGGTTRVFLGQNPTTGSAFRGVINEILIYDTTYNPVCESRVMQYFQRKFG